MKWQVTAVKGNQEVRFMVATPGGISTGEALSKAQDAAAEVLTVIKQEVAKLDSIKIHQVDKDTAEPKDPRQPDLPLADKPVATARPVRTRKLLAHAPTGAAAGAKA